MKKEKIGQDFIFFIFFGTMSIEDWSFGAGRQATVPVQMKVYQRRQQNNNNNNNNKE